MKQDMEVFGQYLVEEIKKLGGRIMTDTPVSRRLIEEEKPDYIYFATGAEPVELNLPGLSHVGTAMAEDVLAGDIMPQEGARVVVLGGGTVGLETAEYLATRVSNLEITVVEMAEKAGKDLGGLKWIMMKSLKKLGVKVLTGLKAVSVEPGKSEESGETGASDKACELGESGKQGEPRESGKPEACGILVAEAETQGETRHIPCDLLIFAVGSRPRGAAGLEEWLRERNIGYAVIGDGKKTGNIMKGLEDAWETIRS
jgi:NADPH-dependent 2,4-dienoyl-CoA reductase/sulfur reductase-like enzyme